MALLQAAGLDLGQALTYVKMYSPSLSPAHSRWEREPSGERPRAAMGTGGASSTLPHFKVNLGRGGTHPSREN